MSLNLVKLTVMPARGIIGLCDSSTVSGFGSIVPVAQPAARFCQTSDDRLWRNCRRCDMTDCLGVEPAAGLSCLS